jgi:hypothetical protein
VVFEEAALPGDETAIHGAAAAAEVMPRYTWTKSSAFELPQGELRGKRDENSDRRGDRCGSAGPWFVA